MNLSSSQKKACVDCPAYIYSRRDFSYFYDCYAPMIYGHFLRKTEDASLADSILADVFLIVWQERVAFNKHQSMTTKQTPLSWLLSIAHRKGL